MCVCAGFTAEHACMCLECAARLGVVRRPVPPAAARARVGADACATMMSVGSDRHTGWCVRVCVCVAPAHPAPLLYVLTRTALLVVAAAVMVC